MYDQLLALTPSPVVALNRAVALAEVEGPRAALVVLDGLAELNAYHLLHAIRADLLDRLDRRAEAAQAYARAVELTDNATERAFLLRRRAALV